MLEAMSCGTPIAAYPVTGPIDVITDGVTGCMNADLAVAVENARKLDRNTVEQHSLAFSWASCTDIFVKNLIQIMYQ